MKIKALILIAAAALVTLSFTFASVTTGKRPEIGSKSEMKAASQKAPAGGFVSEEKF